MKWTGAAQWMKREAKAGDRLPFDAPHRRRNDPASRRLADAHVAHCAACCSRPQDADQLDHAQARARSDAAQHLDARFVLYHHVVRRRVTVGSGGEFDDPRSARAVGKRWRERLAERSPVRERAVPDPRPPPGARQGGLAGEAAADVAAAGAEDDPAAIRDLEAATASLARGARALRARACCRPTRPTLARPSEPLEFLSTLYNGEMRPVLCRPMAATSAITCRTSASASGSTRLETARRGRTRLRRHAVAQGLSGRDCARACSTRFFACRASWSLTESFAPADRQTARERIDLALRRQKVGRRRERWPSAVTCSPHATRSGQGTAGFGDHHFSRAGARAAISTELDDATADGRRQRIADTGAIAVREDTNLEPAVLGPVPGQRALYRPAGDDLDRQHGRLRLAARLRARPGRGQPLGRRGHAARDDQRDAVFFNFHQGDLGNFSIIGPSGLGQDRGAQLPRRAGAEVRARARSSSTRIAARRLFIRAASAGAIRPLRPGEPTGFNPLRAARQRRQPRVPARLARRAAQGRRAGGTGDDRGRGRRRLRQRPVAPPAAVFPRAARRRAPAGGRAIWLAASTRGSTMASTPGCSTTTSDRLDLTARVVGFDMTALLDNPQLRTPAMMYLFHRIEERLDGQPTIILIDEGWKALDDDVFAARIRDWLKTLRKRNALVGFATQCARDALDSRISTALVEQTATMIFMPNAEGAGRGLLRRVRPDRARAGADPHACPRTAAAS